MRDIPKSILSQINETSTSILRSSDNLINITHSVNDHASDNPATAEELSSSMQETAANTDHIYTSIERIGNHSNDISQKASQCNNLSKTLMKQSNELILTTNTALENT
ncbi:MAG: hypothetical protein ACFWTJ_01265 [Lachnoclostridium sp.]